MGSRGRKWKSSNVETKHESLWRGTRGGRERKSSKGRCESPPSKQKKNETARDFPDGIRST